MIDQPPLHGHHNPAFYKAGRWCCSRSMHEDKTTLCQTRHSYATSKFSHMDVCPDNYQSLVEESLQLVAVKVVQWRHHDASKKATQQ